MSSYLLKHLPKSNFVRFHARKSSTSSGAGSRSEPSLSRTSPQQTPSRSNERLPSSSSSGTTSGDSSSSGGIKLAVGLSLGLSLGLLTQDTIIKRIFPEPEKPAPERLAPSLDPKIIEQLISHDRKVNQLESQITSLREDLRERDHKLSQVVPAQFTNKSNGDVFELSEIIQANNMATTARHDRELEEQRRTLVREHLLKVEGEILKVENKYRPIINKIRELESHLETQREVQQKETPARLLWMSCQSLLDRLRYSPQEPLESDPAYGVLKQFATNNNPLAISIIDSIPPKALKEGVQSEDVLLERFSKLETVCKRVALVDAHGAGLSRYLLSYLQSLFILDNIKVPEAELSGDLLVNPEKWSTFDILARVQYCLKRHNLEQAVRYANQLRGQARVVARDWIRDARIHLTTRQAFSSLAAHAEAIAVDSLLNNKMADQS